MKKLLAVLLVLCPMVFGQKPKLIISVSGHLEMDMAEALMDGISYGLKNNDKYEILINDRQFMEALNKEWEEGNISDDKIISLAKNAKADYLCFTKITSVKGVEGKRVTAKIFDLSKMIYTPENGLKDIDENDFYNMKNLTKITLDVVTDMIGTQKTSNFTVSSANKTYSWENFTKAERFGTFFLNHALGLGSYLIMDDGVDAAVILTFEALAVPLLIIGYNIQMPDKSSYTCSYVGKDVNECSTYDLRDEDGNYYSDDKDDAIALKYGLLISGIVFSIIAEAVNLYGSFGYDKPKPRATNFIDRRNFNLAILPTKNGNGMAYGLMYNKRF